MNKYSYRQQAPAPVIAGPMDEEYDYGPSSSSSSPSGHLQQQHSPASFGGANPSSLPPPPQSRPDNMKPSTTTSSSGMDGDEALLDLAQLEELHKEAEKMKALGNKHMATQEYTRAYNAYSAALQLSPVGPSSHVFLSNRAAALLSLKRYNAAATDARRAIALAPTFGKAHARLGQALYFLKDYEGAVQAYQDSMDYEPDNPVTLTYLQKAKTKLDKQIRKLRGEDVSVAATSVATDHYVPSVASADPQAPANVMVGAGYRGTGNLAFVAAARKQVISPLNGNNNNNNGKNGISPSSNASLSTMTTINTNGLGGGGNVSLLGSQHRSQYNDPTADPAFDEALRIQVQANKYLANKQYKNAMEEYTAALFLVPDDVNLSTELHLGRAHALNGSRRHERARNDCLLAIKLKASPAAYSTLAKSYFYMKDYKASLQAFQNCIDLLPRGESLGMFDRAYYEKAEAALEEEEASLSNTSPSRNGFGGGGGSSVYSNKTVPKLPPPRFVPRDEAIQAAPNLPPMPKQWPQQSPRSPSNFRCGPEREVLFLSESLGIKLNRASDGMVRVVSVAPSSPSSTVVRRGIIGPGDVVRECAGVDLRRPITNIMWGDTVALIKMAPRPITFLVAKEISDVPPVVQEEMRRASATTSPSNKYRPSNATGDEPVRQVEEESLSEVTTGIDLLRCSNDSANADAHALKQAVVSDVDVDVQNAADTDVEESEEALDKGILQPKGNADILAALSVEPADLEATESPDMRGLEDRFIGGEILFERSVPASAAYFGWDNLRWLSYSGVRKVAFSQHGYRYLGKEKKQLFWSTNASSYEERLLAVYDEPSLILMLRRPVDDAEIINMRGLSDADEINELSSNQYWVVESVMEPSTCVLKLSPLTSICAIPAPDADERRLSCFELRTPVETVIFTSVRVREDVRLSERSFGDSGAFFEAVATEAALVKKLCTAHDQANSLGTAGADLSWKHQLVQGTIHSAVISGNSVLLENTLRHAMTRAQADADGFADVSKLHPRVIDELDESGNSPLYYAITKQMSQAVLLLVKAGASTDFRNATNGMTLVHISARLLDDKSLSILLASKFPRPNPNSLDAAGRTPMYLACVEGDDNPAGLERCLTALEAWGGRILIRDSLVALRSPVAILASLWRSETLPVVLHHLPFRLPLPKDDYSSVSSSTPMSIDAFYEYPVHSAVSAIGLHSSSLKIDDKRQTEIPFLRTLRILLDHGFEVNGRKDRVPLVDTDYTGFTPLQILTVLSVRQNENAATKSYSCGREGLTLYRDAALFLVQHGGRLTMEPPQLYRPLAGTSEAAVANTSDSCGWARKCVNWASKDEVARVLGVDEAAFRQAWQCWYEAPPIAAPHCLDLLDNDDIVLLNSDAPGGSNEKSCAICWKQFGAILNRKHKCRISRRFLCDDCSTKRVVRGGKQFRVSDGQYILARAAISEHERQERTRCPLVVSTDSIGMSRQERLHADEQSDRNSLFGGMLDQANGLIFGNGVPVERTPSSVGGLETTLGNTRDALNQRGDRLQQLGDRSADLVDASESFAKMAKELAKQSDRGFLW